MNEERQRDLDILKKAREYRSSVLLMQEKIDELSQRFDLSDSERTDLLCQYVDELHLSNESLKALLPMLSRESIKENGYIDTLISLLETERADSIENAVYICDAIRNANDESPIDILERLSKKSEDR